MFFTKVNNFMTWDAWMLVLILIGLGAGVLWAITS